MSSELLPPGPAPDRYCALIIDGMHVGDHLVVALEIDEKRTWSPAAGVATLAALRHPYKQSATT